MELKGDPMSLVVAYDSTTMTPPSTRKTPANLPPPRRHSLPPSVRPMPPYPPTAVGTGPRPTLPPAPAPAASQSVAPINSSNVSLPTPSLDFPDVADLFACPADNASKKRESNESALHDSRSKIPQMQSLPRDMRSAAGKVAVQAMELLANAMMKKSRHFCLRRGRSCISANCMKEKAQSTLTLQEGTLANLREQVSTLCSEKAALETRNQELSDREASLSERGALAATIKEIEEARSADAKKLADMEQRLKASVSAKEVLESKLEKQNNVVDGLWERVAKEWSLAMDLKRNADDLNEKMQAIENLGHEAAGLYIKMIESFGGVIEGIPAEALPHSRILFGRLVILLLYLEFETCCLWRRLWAVTTWKSLEERVTSFLRRVPILEPALDVVPLTMMRDGLNVEWELCDLW
ncbi:unnamed protein product [Miscanthus lutarioriparius]|uniref:Uncharacterized protein n=1 Tax=Miscanthus lutarioriparius TaxID=422564 RepID=A0A811P1M3_9POAL|nr:unnamed protein product [Miscanthus lutarioriparius]